MLLHLLLECGLARLTAKHKDNARPVQDHNARLIIKQ